MKVLIINPPSYDNKLYNKEGRCETKKGAQLTQPITIGIIAALLKNNGFEIEFHDFMVNPLPVEEMKEILLKIGKN